MRRAFERCKQRLAFRGERIAASSGCSFDRMGVVRLHGIADGLVSFEPRTACGEVSELERCKVDRLVALKRHTWLPRVRVDQADELARDGRYLLPVHTVCWRVDSPAGAEGQFPSGQRR